MRKFLVTALAALSLASGVRAAGIPTLDITNLAQNILSAMEGATQTARQIDQYRLQLLQYEQQLKDGIAPAAYIWAEAETTINDLVAATDTLERYRNQLGSLELYMDRFQDVNYYRNSACFAADGCAQEFADRRAFASGAQKEANDALFESIERQQENIRKDARQLQQLQAMAAQSGTATDTGRQLATLTRANQLAGHQSSQLLQIRSLLIAQQNALAVRMQAEADRQAQEDAERAFMYESGYVKSPEVWW